MRLALGWLLCAACASSHDDPAPSDASVDISVRDAFDASSDVDALPMCDVAALQAELAAAQSGDTVHAAACAYMGYVDVPPGVTLIGAGMDATTFTQTGDDRELERSYVIALMPGSTPTRLIDLSVVDSTLFGIGAYGQGEVVIERVRVRGTRPALSGFAFAAIVIAAEAVARTADVVVDGNVGTGLLVDLATAENVRLSVRGGVDGVVSQRGANVVIRDSSIESVMGRAVSANERGTLRIESTTIRGTLEMMYSGAGAIRVGYGVDLGGTPLPVFTFVGLDLRDNAVAPMRIDLTNGWPEGSSFENVTVDGDIVIENGTPPDGWDDGITVVR